MLGTALGTDCPGDVFIGLQRPFQKLQIAEMEGNGENGRGDARGRGGGVDRFGGGAVAWRGGAELGLRK